MELHPLTWGKCWKSMSHHGHWDKHPRTYSVSREPTWKPTVTDHLVPVPQNYGISSQIIFGQLGVWQFSNDNWKHICSKMSLSNNYVDINIYPLTMNVMRLWACLYGKGAISNDNIIIIYYYIIIIIIIIIIIGHINSIRFLLSLHFSQNVHKGLPLISMLCDISLVKNFLYKVLNCMYRRQVSSISEISEVDLNTAFKEDW